MKSAARRVTIEETIPVLAKSEKARNELRDLLGLEAVDMLVSGIIKGDLGGKIYDILDDLIYNNSKTVSEEELPNGYPIKVNVYEGIYYVYTPEYEPIGYFLSEEHANECILTDFMMWFDS